MENSTSQGQPNAEITFFTVVNIALCAFVLSINLFVASLFYKKRSVLKTASNRLLLSLLVCDSLSGINILVQVTVHLLFKNIAIVRLLTDIITAFLAHTSVLHLCGITLDRFIALFFALRYRQIVTIKTTMRYLQCAWLVSFVTSAIQFSWAYKELKVIKLITKKSNDLKITNVEKCYSLVIFTLFLFIPMLFLGAAFSAMFCEIRKILLKTPALKMRRKLSGKAAQQRRVLYIFSVMYVCFGMFAMPYFTIRMMEDFKMWNTSPLLLDLVYTLKITPSITNPILYTANNKDFRTMIKISLIKAKKCLFHPFRRFSFNMLQSYGSDNRQTSFQMSSLLELTTQKSYNVNSTRTNSFISNNHMNNYCGDNII